ncbi:MAG: tetratricopeptide repeat protein [Candidatus Thorarchaeota archaeon]
MIDSILKKIDQGWELLNEGKEKEALQLILEIENNPNLTPIQELRYKILKGLLYFFLGRFEEAIEIAENSYEEGVKLKNPLLSIDSYLVKWISSLQLDKFNNPQIFQASLKELELSKKLLKFEMNESISEVKQREAILNYIEGFFSNYYGETDIALKQLSKSLIICKEIDHLAFLIPRILMVLGQTYSMKGDVNNALVHYEESLELLKGNSIGTKTIYGNSWIGIANIYFQQGNLDLAIKQYKRIIEEWEPSHSPRLVSRCYSYLIYSLLNKESFELAKDILHEFSHFMMENESAGNLVYYKLSRARLLKASTRVRDRAEAERILKELIVEFDTNDKNKALLYYSSTAWEWILFELCEFYIEELKSTNDLDILNDIQPLIGMLLSESERTNSYWIQARTNLFQGKISLLQMNIGDARCHLTQAQHIAEEHGLQLLAREISGEHDRLLEILDDWQKLERKKVSVSERIDLAALDDTMVYLQGRRVLNPPELIEEDSILLLIMDRYGVSYFNHTFIENWDFSDLFSSFMSAFNTFSSEIFEKSIDRIRIDENVILINPVEQFLVCYVIKGQSYPALQKLNRFSDAIKWKPDIWEALNKAVHTSEVLELNNPSSLGEIVTEIFYQ